MEKINLNNIYIMSRDEYIIASARVLMGMGVLGGAVSAALGIALSNLAPYLIVKAVALSRYPIIFNGYVVNYADPCGWCHTSNCKCFGIFNEPSLAYCPGCREIHTIDDGVPPSASGMLLTY